MTDQIHISLSVNGRAVSLTTDPTAPLLDVLRGPLGLTAARYGCGAELCGACLVLVDGTPVYACTREVGSLVGHVITTVEGLGTADAPHPIQAALLAEQAGQCGYCLSGMQIAAAALLARNSAPTRAEIAAALDGNLCRCGAHPRILAAVARAAEAVR
jgi:nicotinate dehydrogenase subunit A